MRKSITTRYFYSTAFLLVCGVALMWFIQMYLAMGYFRTENDDNLLATVDNTIRILQEAGGSAAPGDEETVEDIKREILITARASGGQIFLTDADGVVVCAAPRGRKKTTWGSPFRPACWPVPRSAAPILSLAHWTGCSARAIM